MTGIVRDSSGRIWIGTFGGGIALYDAEKGIVKTVTKEQGLIENDICLLYTSPRFSGSGLVVQVATVSFGMVL